MRYKRLVYSLSLFTLVGGSLGAVAFTGPAAAVSCTSPVRFAPATNTIYLTGGGSFTPEKIQAACALSPFRLVDPATRTWELAADLVLQGGSTLVLRGKSAGGGIDVLRIRSLASNAATEVQQIYANYGSIEIDSVNITSWDTAANGPDVNASQSASPETGDRARAFIRAVTTMASDGKTAQTSKMIIRNSRLSNLGYYGGEAYGVSYKARGCDRDHVSACKKLRVSGEQINSVFDRNYMGTYTWGAYGMTFRGNTYSNNIAYGLDPHDVSSNLVIDKNTFTSNGNHGLICSERCDKLTITNNVSEHNGAQPADDAEEDTDLQVHGIMLHRGVTNSTIIGNRVTDQPTGAGIAIFDSTNNTVSGNTLTGNNVGIRLSVGSAKNTISNNVINDSTLNAISLYAGNDDAKYSTSSSRPTSNTFKDNTISGTGNNGIRIVDSDKNTFSGKSMDGLGGPLLFTRAIGNRIEKIKFPPAQPVKVTGSSKFKSTLTIVAPKGAVVVTVDKYSKVTLKQ